MEIIEYQEKSGDNLENKGSLVVSIYFFMCKVISFISMLFFTGWFLYFTYEDIFRGGSFIDIIVSFIFLFCGTPIVAGLSFFVTMLACIVAIPVLCILSVFFAIFFILNSLFVK